MYAVYYILKAIRDLKPLPRIVLPPDEYNKLITTAIVYTYTIKKFLVPALHSELELWILILNWIASDQKLIHLPLRHFSPVYQNPL